MFPVFIYSFSNDMHKVLNCLVSYLLPANKKVLYIELIVMHISNEVGACIFFPGMEIVWVWGGSSLGVNCFLGAREIKLK